MLFIDEVADVSTTGPSGPVKLAKKEVAKPATKVCHPINVYTAVSN